MGVMGGHLVEKRIFYGNSNSVRVKAPPIVAFLEKGNPVTTMRVNAFMSKQSNADPAIPVSWVRFLYLSQGLSLNHPLTHIPAEPVHRDLIFCNTHLARNEVWEGGTVASLTE